MSRFIIAAVFLATLVPAPSYAWGNAAHRYIMDRAIELLPPEVKPFFVHYRSELLIRVTDPDTWRVLGWDDDPNHFLDFGVPEYGPYPFTALPRDYGAAVEKFGVATLKRYGQLPWRIAEEAGNLRRTFEGIPKGVPYASGNAMLFAAATAHYVQDANDPFHATDNFDGQLTGQTGVHSRFETALFERFHERLAIVPAAPAPVRHPRDAAFDTLLASYKQVQPVLDADKAAAQGRDTYDDGFFEQFFVRVKPILEERIGSAITGTASMFIGMWEEAGRPALSPDLPHAPQKIRRGQ